MLTTGERAGNVAPRSLLDLLTALSSPDGLQYVL